MSLTELFPVVSQLSHQDKLRLIHFLLLAVAVAKDEGYELETTDTQTQEDLLLQQLATTDAVVWSPYDAHEAAQTVSELSRSHTARCPWLRVGDFLLDCFFLATGSPNPPARQTKVTVPDYGHECLEGDNPI